MDEQWYRDVEDSIRTGLPFSEYGRTIYEQNKKIAERSAADAVASTVRATVDPAPAPSGPSYAPAPERNGRGVLAFVCAVLGALLTIGAAVSGSPPGDAGQTVLVAGAIGAVAGWFVPALLAFVFRAVVAVLGFLVQVLLVCGVIGGLIALLTHLAGG